MADDVSSVISEPIVHSYSGSDEWLPLDSENTETDVENSVPNTSIIQDTPEIQEPEKPPRTRKKQMNGSVVKKRAILRNTGKEYTTKRGKIVAGKVFTNTDCFCKNKCLQQIPEEERAHAFKSFWKLGSFSTQNASRPKDQSRSAKSVSNQYYIQAQGQTINVCKKFFLQTFKISSLHES
ncbi:uncharacterized protein [Diabrotica undecimpunctata]|uniref:uncharacterized protein n=1 Tax=Diabrotica undecimpunctata TaxID=50387 RepID=UPI003B63B2E5